MNDDRRTWYPQFVLYSTHIRIVFGFEPTQQLLSATSFTTALTVTTVVTTSSFSLNSSHNNKIKNSNVFFPLLGVATAVSETLLSLNRPKHSRGNCRTAINKLQQ
jgi:hypothetical protein